MPDRATAFGYAWPRIACSALVLFMLAALPYLGGRHYAFVYDDHGQIADNPFLQSAGRWTAVLTLRTVNDAAVINGRRPMVLLSQLVDRAVWELNPTGWRATNYVLHALSVLLLYLLVVRITRRQALAGQGHNLFAFIAALLWAWHPAMVEAVQVPAFRPDLMVALFGLIALHGSLANRDCAARGCKVCGAVVVWLGVLGAVLSKESGIIVPVLIGLCWCVFPKTRPSRAVMASLLSGAVMILALYVWACARPAPDGSVSPSLQAIGAEWNGRSLLYPDNLYTLPWLWAAYVRVLVWPVPLIVDRVVIPVSSPLTWRFIVGLCALCAAFGMGWIAWRKGWMWIVFGVGLMLAGFAPVSNLVPLLNPMAERYMPLMIMGFAVTAAWCLTASGLRAGRGRRVRTLVLAALLVGYCLGVVWRVRDFRDDETLWRRTLQSEPRSSRAHTWMGLLLQQQDRLVEASEYFGRARVLNPYDLTPRINKAILYGRLGQLGEAEFILREAAAIRPSFPAVHWNLAVVLKYQGRMDEALEALNEALRLDPYHIEARKARIVLYVDRGRYDDALHDAEELMRLTPDDPEARAAYAYARERGSHLDIQH